MHLLGSAVAFLILFLSPLPLAAQREIAPSTSGDDRVTIFGSLRDAETNQGVENVLVQLRHFNGSTAASVFTSPNGNFNFTSIPRGNYNLTIQHEGYQRIDQQMSLTSLQSAVSLRLELHRIDGDGAGSGGSNVSVRELSIPRKAHDAMQKGLKLLHQESDHKRSLTQFRQAIKAK